MKLAFNGSLTPSDTPAPSFEPDIIDDTSAAEPVGNCSKASQSMAAPMQKEGRCYTQADIMSTVSIPIPQIASEMGLQRPKSIWPYYEGWWPPSRTWLYNGYAYIYRLNYSGWQIWPGSVIIRATLMSSSFILHQFLIAYIRLLTFTRSAFFSCHCTGVTWYFIHLRKAMSCRDSLHDLLLTVLTGPSVLASFYFHFRDWCFKLQYIICHKSTYYM